MFCWMVLVLALREIKPEFSIKYFNPTSGEKTIFASVQLHISCIDKVYIDCQFDINDIKVMI